MWLSYMDNTYHEFYVREAEPWENKRKQLKARMFWITLISAANTWNM